MGIAALRLHHLSNLMLLQPLPLQLHRLKLQHRTRIQGASGSREEEAGGEGEAGAAGSGGDVAKRR